MLAVAERRKKIHPGKSRAFIGDLERMRISVDVDGLPHAFRTVLGYQGFTNAAPMMRRSWNSVSAAVFHWRLRINPCFEWPSASESRSFSRVGPAIDSPVASIATDEGLAEDRTARRLGILIVRRRHANRLKIHELVMCRIGGSATQSSLSRSGGSVER